ncbi:hypothetical protein AGMMS50267_10330 [Spirochaetia bacterium]|nr:hypothetical protein AGMMS50267_10330 [Spirochaetia bacterium]
MERSHFTVDFESLAISFLLASKNRTAVADLLSISWDEMDGIMQRAVKRGLLCREEVPIVQLGIDEKSFGSGKSYGTVLYDPKGKRVLNVVQKRDGEAVDTVFYSSLTYREHLKTSVFRCLPLKKAFAQSLDEQMQGHRKN